MFDRLVWKSDRMLLDDLVFRLQHYKRDDWDLGDECFIFYKIKELVDQYAHFFATRADFRPERVFELGIWDGGSTAFWFELLHPAKHVAIDFDARGDSDYFKRYLTERGNRDRVATYWKTDQGNKSRLREIARREFDGPLDLVIDDASHLYHLTKASFEALFPLVRPGGFYIIEDWAWEHWRGIDPLSPPPSLTQLVVELIEATGSSKSLIQSVNIYEGFAVVERGPEVEIGGEDFSLDSHIYRQKLPPEPKPLPGWRIGLGRVRQRVSGILGSRTQ